MGPFISASKIAMVILSITIFFCLYRAVSGPTMLDRVIGINIIGTKAVVIFVLVGVVFKNGFFFDLAMVYALLLYVATIGFVKYLEFRRLDK